MMWLPIFDVILFFHKKGINDALTDINFRSFDAKAKLTSGKEELKRELDESLAGADCIHLISNS